MKPKTLGKVGAGKQPPPTITYPVLSPGKATFIVADRTTREVAWNETPSLPAQKVQACVEKAERDNDDATPGMSYGYDIATLVKLQETQIGIAAVVVSQLGKTPTTADDDNAYYALIHVRDLLPDPFRVGASTKRSLWQ